MSPLLWGSDVNGHLHANHLYAQLICAFLIEDVVLLVDGIHMSPAGDLILTLLWFLPLLWFQVRHNVQIHKNTYVRVCPNSTNSQGLGFCSPIFHLNQVEYALNIVLLL